MKTILHLKLKPQSSVGGHHSLKAEIDNGGYVKYSAWIGWTSGGVPVAECDIDGRLPPGPEKEESIEVFTKRVTDYIQFNTNWAIAQVVKPFALSHLNPDDGKAS